MMKRLRLLLLLPVLALSLVFSLSPVRIAQAQNVQDFDIKSFAADYYLGKNADNEAELRVEERITAVFPEYDQNHGILRAIPKTYEDKSLQLKVAKVTDRLGNAYSYSSSTQNDNLVLKIGDAGKYVHGEKTYVISYTMRDVITYYDEHDEWFWDVNGTEWMQPFGSVTARIHIPNGLAESISKSPKCFTGALGSTASNCEITQSVENDATIINVRAANLLPGQNLSFVMGFEKNTFSPYQPSLWEVVRPLLFLSPLVLLPLLTTIWLVSRWRNSGRDPKGKGVIVPQYTPPKGLNAITSEGIMQEKVRTSAITAAIIELAIAKYLIIHEIASDKKHAKPEYSIELVKPLEGLTAEQLLLVQGLFGKAPSTGQKVEMKSLKNKLYGDVVKIHKQTMQSLYKDGYFANDPIKAPRGFMIGGVLATLIGFMLAFTVILTPIGIGLITSGLIMMFAARTMPARSVKGVETKEYLLGLKAYIKLAEKDRIAFLQSPEGVKQFGQAGKHSTQVKLFETLLPYAMLFGLEKQWAEQFKDLYNEPPEWYQGNTSAFRTGYLVGSLHSFNTAATSTFTAPSSSGSSGFSGGGGSSGGGGGGGGGGGW